MFPSGFFPTPKKINMPYLIVLLVLLFYSSNVKSYEYCSVEKKICKTDLGRRHIACDPKQLKKPKLVEEIHYPITEKMRTLLVEKHNEYRNATACGNIKDKKGNQYPTATKMQTVSWDYELEYLAKVHTKQCAFEHDSCRNTQRFPRAGQNLALHSTFACARDIKGLKVANDSMWRWYDEHRLAEIEKHLLLGVSFDDVGHFTLIVNERVTKVGCAMVICVKNNETKVEITFKSDVLLTCDYNYNNVMNRTTYTFGEVGSQCVDFKKKRLPNSCLCG